MVTSYSTLQESVATYMTRTAEKLRHQHFVCEVIQVFVQTNQFRPTEPRYSNAVTVPLASPSRDTRLMVRAVLFGLAQIYRLGLQYKEAGVVLGGLTDASVQQQSLFRTFGAGEGPERVMSALDPLNQRFGAGTLKMAVVGVHLLAYAIGEFWRINPYIAPCFEAERQGDTLCSVLAAQNL